MLWGCVDDAVIESKYVLKMVDVVISGAVLPEARLMRMEEVVGFQVICYSALDDTFKVSNDNTGDTYQPISRWIRTGSLAFEESNGVSPGPDHGKVANVKTEVE